MNKPSLVLQSTARRPLACRLSSIACFAMISLLIASGCASAPSRAGDVTITSPKAEEIVGPEFQIDWRSASEVMTVVIHLEGSVVPVIKQFGKHSGDTYRITTPGHYIGKVFIEGRGAPEHEVWFNVAAEDPTAAKKGVKITFPENGADVSGWFPVSWSETDLALTLVFYNADVPILKARGLRSGTEFALPKPGLWEARFFVKDRKVPVASVWFTNKPSTTD